MSWVAPRSMALAWHQSPGSQQDRIALVLRLETLETLSHLELRPGYLVAHRGVSKKCESGIPIYGSVKMMNPLDLATFPESQARVSGSHGASPPGEGPDMAGRPHQVPCSFGGMTIHRAKIGAPDFGLWINRST